MFLAGRIRFRVREALDVCAVTPSFTQWAIGDTLKTINPALGALAHKRSTFLGTSGPLVDGAPPLSDTRLEPGEEFTLRVSVGGKALAEALGVLLRRDSLSIGIGPKGSEYVRCEAVATMIDGAGETPATFVQFCTAASKAPEGPMRMNFISPTTFKRHDTWLALPAPDNVFGEVRSDGANGLAGRWMTMGGPPLPSGFSGAKIGCTPQQLEGVLVRTHTPLKGGTSRPARVRAFTGTCDYFATDAETRSWMWALALFAQYVGVGNSPSMGLGWVECGPAR